LINFFVGVIIKTLKLNNNLYQECRGRELARCSAFSGTKLCQQPIPLKAGQGAKSSPVFNGER
jgi:hypothetical protein